MKVKFLLFADAVNSSVEGKLNITGEFDTVLSQQFPFVWPQLVVVARIDVVGSDEGVEQVAQFKLFDGEGIEVLQTAPFPIRFVTPNASVPPRANVVATIGGVVIPKTGNYKMALLIGDQRREEAVLYVRERPTT